MPAPGFSGAAALDGEGRLYGMVAVRAPQAAVVPLERMMNFLEANYVAPQSGRTGLDAAKASVVRVICVRK